MTKSKVYTTTGDNGATSLVGGVRVKKTDIRIEAYGSIDELNANIGVLLAIPCLQPAAVDLLHQVQNRLFSIGAYLATPNPDNAITRCAGLSAENVEAIENVIDHFDAQLPRSTISCSRVEHTVPPYATCAAQCAAAASAVSWPWPTRHMSTLTCCATSTV